MNERKPWTGKNGENLSNEELREQSKEWTCGVWEEFLKATVERPLRETLTDSVAVDDLEDKHRVDYQEMLAHTEHSPRLAQVVGTLMRRLTIREREVIDAIFWQGMSQQELANKLRIKKSAVRSYRDRALRKLGVLLVERLLPESEDGLPGKRAHKVNEVLAS